MTTKLYLPSSMAPRKQAPEIWIPGQSRPAVKKIAIVFYHQKSTGRILVGAPEQYPLPSMFARMGYEKIVCTTAQDVDRWDKKYREQEKRENEMTDEQREAIEGPIRQMVRAELVTSMLNARNEVNREFCRAAIARLDEDWENKKMKRESFQHIVGYEDGH